MFPPHSKSLCCHLIHIPNEGFDALDLVRANWTGPVIENGGLPLAKANRATFYTGMGDDRLAYTDYPAATAQGIEA